MAGKEKDDCYVLEESCHIAMDGLNKQFQDVQTRIGDLKDTLNLVVTLLKNGR